MCGVTLSNWTRDLDMISKTVKLVSKPRELNNKDSMYRCRLLRVAPLFKNEKFREFGLITYLLLILFNPPIQIFIKNCVFKILQSSIGRYSVSWRYAKNPRCKAFNFRFSFRLHESVRLPLLKYIVDQWVFTSKMIKFS